MNFYKLFWSVVGVVLSILLISYLLSTILPQKYLFISFAVLLGLLAIREINEKELTEETIKKILKERDLLDFVPDKFAKPKGVRAGEPKIQRPG